MSRILAFPVLILLLSFAAAAQTADGKSAPQPIPAEFTGGIARYMDIHRAAAAAVGPEVQHMAPQALFEQKWAFVDAIRRARPCDENGTIFTPDTAAFFRVRIATALQEAGVDVGDVLRDMDEDWDEEAPLPEANDPFPWAAGNMMWPSMLARLPQLPRELEYRFVGRDLVLLDVRVDLVVDVLMDALPDAEGEVPVDAGQISGVHAELPADVG